MASERLLKRLKRLQENDGRTPEMDPAELVDVVLADIQELLNTIKGTALINPDMGLSDVKNMFVSHGELAISQLTEEIVSNVRQFEKRVDQVYMEQIETKQAGTLMWRFDGVVFDRRGNIPFSSDLSIGPDGRVRINSRN